MKLVLKILQWLTAMALLIGAPIAGFVAIENWRGQQALAHYQKELEDEGFRFGPEVLRGEPIPDSENFGKIPLLAPFFDTSINPATDIEIARDEAAQKAIFNLSSEEIETLGRQAQLGSWRAGNASSPSATEAAKLLAKMERGVVQMQTLAEAVRRYHRVAYPLHYERGIRIRFGYLTPMMQFSRAFSVRGSLHIILGHAQQALADTETGLLLARFSKSPPLEVPMLVYNSMLVLPLRPLWDGLHTHLWSEENLRQLSGRLDEFSPFADLDLAIRGEMATTPLMFNQIYAVPWQQKRAFLEFGVAHNPRTLFLESFPVRGWFYQNAVTQLHEYRDKALSEFDVAERRSFPADARQHRDEDQAAHITPYRFDRLDSYFYRTLRRTSHTAQSIDFARLGCALERYRLQKHAYPTTLKLLVPSFIAALPNDVCNGEPLHYRPEGDGYRIWSVGWNLQNEAGEIARLKPNDSNIDYDKGDWVWLMPGAADSTAQPAQ